MNDFLKFCKLLYQVSPVHVFDRVTQWVVVGWMISHTVSWVFVETCRLYQATRIKVQRIFKQEVAEE